MRIAATYREPFSFTPRVRHLEAGANLAEMRRLMPGLPGDFDSHGVICLNGFEVPRESWPLVRPRAPAVTEITFHYPPRGGGDDTGKNILATIASIGLTILTAGIASGGWAATGTWFAAGSASAYALAAGVSLVGSMLLSSLIAPPVPRKQQKNDDAGNASASGNVLQVNAAIPRVIGQRKVFPPLASEPFVYFDGPDEIVEAAYVLAGPHQISNIRVGAAPIDSMQDVQFEVREGWPGDPVIDLLTRQARSENLRAELRGHVLSDADNKTLEPVEGGYALAVPQPQLMSTRDRPDEHQIQIAFPQGLGNTANANVRLRVPVRLRLRQVGSSTWINLPELHYQGGRIGQMRGTIKLVWTSDVGIAPAASTGEGWAEARYRSPGQSAAPAQPDYVANSYFYAGSGDEHMDSNTLGSTGLRRIALDRYTAELRLDPAVFPIGRYEIEMVRGCSFRKSDYAPATYAYGGSVWDFFGFRGATPEIAMSTENVADALYILRSASIWNEHPLPSRDLAVVAVRARNRAVENVSCMAGGWVKDWDGSAWVTWTVTSNPAPHLRDIFAGAENADPIPAALIDEAGLVAFRQHCITMGYSCNAIMEDQTVDDAARIVASCGYARPYMSDTWGVIMDRDTSADPVMQIFTPRNMNNFKWTRGFPALPDGFRVNFPDASRDYELHQISVFRPGFSDDSGKMEQVTYEGLVTEAEARAKARYNMAQPEFRGTFFSWDAAAESIMCRKGSLVGIAHNTFSEWSGAARIISAVITGGLITALTLDQSLPVDDYPFLDDIANLSAEDNLSVAGLEVGIGIRRDTGVTLHYGAAVAGNVVTFSPGIDPDGIEEDTLVVCGPVSQEFKRLIVTGIVPASQFTATITAVDEAPQLWS